MNENAFTPQGIATAHLLMDEGLPVDLFLALADCGFTPQEMEDGLSATTRLLDRVDFLMWFYGEWRMADPESMDVDPALTEAAQHILDMIEDEFFDMFPETTTETEETTDAA